MISLINFILLSVFCATSLLITAVSFVSPAEIKLNNKIRESIFVFLFEILCNKIMFG